MPNPLVSVIIPTYQAADNIEACIASVRQQDLPHAVEIIVVDNGSTDDTRSRVSRLPVTLLTEPRRGRSAARNRGSRVASGRYLAFIDADCEAQSNWLRRSLSALERDWIGAVQVRVQKFGRPPPAEHFTQAYYYRPFLDTCALVTTREAFTSAHGYDEELRRNVDMDFSFRLLSCGYAFSWLPSVIMTKHHDLTPSQALRRGWDGGLSVSVLAKKWPQFSPREPLRVWRDRGAAFAKAVVRDVRERRSGGRESLEAAVKLLAAAYSDWRGLPVRRESLVPTTKLALLLGTERSLVLLEDGALLFDAEARSIARFDSREVAALCELVEAADEGKAVRSLTGAGWSESEARVVLNRLDARIGDASRE